MVRQMSDYPWLPKIGIGADSFQSGTHDLGRISNLAGCGNSKNRGCEEVVATDLRAESLLPSTEGTLSSKLPSSPEVGAQGPRTVARRF